MPVKAKISPVLCTACGAVVSYYCLFPLYRSGLIKINTLLVLVFIPVAVLCLFRVLAGFRQYPAGTPAIPADRLRTARLLRLMSLYATAFAAGLALGIGAGIKAVPAVTFGIPIDTARGISGTLLEDPRLISGGRAMAALSLKMMSGSGGVRASAHGEITVFFPEESAGRLLEFGRGAEIFAEGNLRGGTEKGAYVFSAETLHITGPAPPLERFRTGLRQGLVKRFSRLSPGRADAGEQRGEAAVGGLALALLLGIRDNLDTGLAAMYRNAGCSHILALSGMHLAVLAMFISLLFRKPLGLRPAALTGAFIIIAYCFLAGPLPSLNRAALMYLLGVLAVLGMLKREPLNLLCMAFLLQLIITPSAGLSLSFILSYLALAGILTIGELLNNIFKGMVPAFFLQPLSASLGAFIATAGVTSWFFGTLRPVGILAGLLLAPLATVFMTGSLAWLALDFTVPALSFLLGKPLSLLYRFMEKTASLAANMPGIRANSHLVIWMSLTLLVLLIFLDHRRRLSANRLEPFA